ncbi:hypothetical protein B7Z17_03420 [Candidatus Saccharibacteria bacterium 32-49-10]|nr:MAG: hypothetical protein B7Z17_03420 [Candidatus Saccharibacteria bacterium 32-49-10]
MITMPATMWWRAYVQDSPEYSSMDGMVAEVTALDLQLVEAGIFPEKRRPWQWWKPDEAVVLLAPDGEFSILRTANGKYYEYACRKTPGGQLVDFYAPIPPLNESGISTNYEQHLDAQASITSVIDILRWHLSRT